VDRQRARFFDLRLDELREKWPIVHLLPAACSSDIKDKKPAMPSAGVRRKRLAFKPSRRLRST